MATPVKKKRAAERAKERDARTEKVYRKPVGAPQRRRATKDEPRPRADAKSRPTRETSADKRRKKVAERDKRTEKVYKKREHREVPEYASLYRLRENMNPDEVSRPYATWRDTLPASGQTGSTTVGVGDVAPPAERDRPRPMIRAGVGPVAQLSSQAAHTYGYTPEAYNELSQIPTTLRPPTEDEHGLSGFYQPTDDSIPARRGIVPRALAGLGYIPPEPNRDSITMIAGQGGEDSGTLAHEQAHGWWFRRGLDDAAKRPEYQQRFNQWAAQPGPLETFEDGSTGAALPGVAATSQQNLDEARARGYYGDPQQWPTELYARTVQFTPNAQRTDWPDEVRPYYSGFLQGMDTLQGGGPTGPIPRNQIIDEGPDANGRYGSPALRWWR
jgi:hypothetical protein